ncbi:MAG: 5,10-methylenetetrahydromethanopterin reductase [Candidatus Azotimanducaceae bacterium]|jgi:5,10-methylenetetrahydromethanopterin reductase
MKYSVAFASEVDSWKWVKQAEDLGFHEAWFYDTQLLNPDVFICMALAAHETSRIRLGTGVLVPSNRIEPVAANAFASLNKLAPGRIDFGVGTGFTARRTMGLGAIGLAKTRTYIERVRDLLDGKTVDWDFESQDRKIQFLNPDLGLIDLESEVPVWLSAFGPKSKALAAELNAGWLNFGAQGAMESLQEMQTCWQSAGRNLDTLQSNLFFLGAVLNSDQEENDKKLMQQAAPQTAVMFHNFADDVGAMGGQNLPQGPISNLLAEYLKVYETYQPEDAKYLTNHRGHLMFVRPEETHITPELVQATTMSGSHEELVERMRQLQEWGYDQVTIQLVHGHEAAIEEWAEVFKQV